MFSRRKFADIKSLINLALVRLNTVRKKTNQELALKKRMLAKNLQEGEFASARLEAERIVKLDWKVEALNMLEIKCEEVRDNVPLLQSQKEVPYDLDEAVSTVIYCYTRAPIPELKEVVRVLERKYGQEFIQMNKNNGAKRVDERLVHRLSGQRPNAFLVYNYMKEIAANFGIEWVEDEVTKALGERFDVPMTAGAPGVASASGLGAAAYAVTDGRIMPKGMKPKGFVPPPKPDFVLPSEEKGDEGNDSGKPGEGGDEGGDSPPPAGGSGDNGGNAQVKKATPPTAPKPVAKPPAQPKPKPVQRKPPPKVVKATPKKPDDLADLQARFEKLQDL